MQLPSTRSGRSTIDAETPERSTTGDRSFPLRPGRRDGAVQLALRQLRGGRRIGRRSRGCRHELHVLCGRGARRRARGNQQTGDEGQRDRQLECKLERALNRPLAGGDFRAPCQSSGGGLATPQRLLTCDSSIPNRFPEKTLKCRSTPADRAHIKRQFLIFVSNSVWRSRLRATPADRSVRSPRDRRPSPCVGCRDDRSSTMDQIRHSIVVANEYVDLSLIEYEARLHSERAENWSLPRQEPVALRGGVSTSDQAGWWSLGTPRAALE